MPRTVRPRAGAGRRLHQAAAAETVVLPKSVPDPIEPFNRVMWGFNKGLMTDVIKPTSKVYRFVVVKPVRTGIGNFGRNLTYPGRLINNLLQGKWSGARDETCRFLGNSTVGIAGFFDVATKWKIPKSDADFGQTFGQWGWKPNCFLMLPFLGPSNDRDTVGWAADTAANPLLYIAPYKFDANNPLTYLGPYTYFTYAVMYNDLSDTVRESVRFSQAEMDPYSEIQYAWTFARENRVADFQVKGKPDPASLETLESVFFTYKDPAFPGPRPDPLGSDSRHGPADWRSPIGCSREKRRWFISFPGWARTGWPKPPWRWPSWFTKTASPPCASAALSTPSSWKMPRRRRCPLICRWMATTCTSLSPRWIAV